VSWYVDSLICLRYYEVPDPAMSPFFSRDDGVFSDACCSLGCLRGFFHLRYAFTRGSLEIGLHLPHPRSQMVRRVPQPFAVVRIHFPDWLA